MVWLELVAALYVQQFPLITDIQLIHHNSLLAKCILHNIDKKVRHMGKSAVFVTVKQRLLDSLCCITDQKHFVLKYDLQGLKNSDT